MRDNKHTGQRLIPSSHALLLILGTTAAIVSAQGGGGGATPQPLANPSTETKHLLGGEEAGGNSAVIVGNNGVIVVDTKTATAAAGAELVADVAKITPKPITTLYFLHTAMEDHVNGLASFPNGIAVIAQENCKTEMEAAANHTRRGCSGQSACLHGLSRRTWRT